MLHFSIWGSWQCHLYLLSGSDICSAQHLGWTADFLSCLQWFSADICCGLTTMCLPQEHVSGHLTLSSQCSMGRLWTLQEVERDCRKYVTKDELWGFEPILISCSVSWMHMECNQSCSPVSVACLLHNDGLYSSGIVCQNKPLSVLSCFWLRCFIIVREKKIMQQCSMVLASPT